MLIFGLITLFLIYHYLQHLREKFRSSRCIHGESKLVCYTCKEIQKADEIKKELQLRAQVILTNKKIAESKLAELITEDLLRDIDYLKNLNPYEFESKVGKMFSKLGYSVKQTPKANDMGMDLIMKKNNELHLVECKKYTDVLVSRPEIQKFYTACHVNNAALGYFVTTSDFTSSAIDYIRETKLNIVLINGYKLIDLMKDAYPDRQKTLFFDVICEQCGNKIEFEYKDKGSKVCNCGSSVKSDFDRIYSKVHNEKSKTSDSTYCPICDARMKKIVGQFGKFWGCTNYPRCIGKREYQSKIPKIPKNYLK